MSHLRRWGAAYLLVVLFAGSASLHWWAQVRVGGAPWHEFVASTFENWQSEWAQLFVQGIVFLALGHALFAADKEDMERLEAKVDRLLGVTDDPDPHHETAAPKIPDPAILRRIRRRLADRHGRGSQS